MTKLGQIKLRLLDKLFSIKTVKKYPELRPAYRVKSHLTVQERLKLFQLASGRKRVLEIGSYLGASATCFGAALKEIKNAQVYCIDTWNNDAMTEGKMETFKEFKNNTAPFGNVIVPVRGFSTHVVETIRQMTPTIDVLFIDGDHSYEGAKADWESYKSFVNVGSIVIFHDFGWAEGVKRVIDEDVRQFVEAADELPNMWWGTIKQKP
jgi:predicted O-methyltransferase YrrM